MLDSATVAVKHEQPAFVAAFGWPLGDQGRRKVKIVIGGAVAAGLGHATNITCGVRGSISV